MILAGFFIGNGDMDSDLSTGTRAGNHFNRLIEAAADLISSGNLTCFPPMAVIAERAGLTEARAVELFSNSENLLNTVAQQGMIRLNDISTRMTARVPAGDLIGQVEALSLGYLIWSVENPGLFILVSQRNISEFLRQGDVERYDEGIRLLLTRLLVRAREQGLLPPQTDINRKLLALRSMLYGLARMHLDRHLLNWLPQDADITQMLTDTVRDFVRHDTFRDADTAHPG